MSSIKTLQVDGVYGQDPMAAKGMSGATFYNRYEPAKKRFESQFLDLIIVINDSTLKQIIENEHDVAREEHRLMI